MKKTLMCIALLFSFFPAFAQRSFDRIFPGLSENIRREVFAHPGLIRTYSKNQGFNLIGTGTPGNPSRLATNITGSVLEAKPGYIVESVLVIPGKNGTASLLDIYNALGNVSGLKGRSLYSRSKNRNVVIFENATRVTNARRPTPIPDPPSATRVPARETIYLCLKDANFGNTYYRGEIGLVQNGIMYSLTNNRSLTFLFIPVVREGRFTAHLYFEPIIEGILIYGIAGIDIPGFIASMININTAIRWRLEAIISWVVEGIEK